MRIKRSSNGFLSLSVFVFFFKFLYPPHSTHYYTTTFKISFKMIGLYIGAIFSVITCQVVAAVDGSQIQDRFLIAGPSFSFTTFTVLKVTTTSTSTFTSTTTCTTSTAVLSSCTTGRRRRGLFYDETKAESRRQRSALFYLEDDVQNNDGTVFLPADKK
jgi:hypothetical protein